MISLEIIFILNLLIGEPETAIQGMENWLCGPLGGLRIQLKSLI
jgi:hypothetical protein